MLANPLSYFLVLMLSLVEVRPQTCVTQKIVTSSYSGTYAKTYRDSHGLFTMMAVKSFQKSELKESEVCCEGYNKVYENYDGSIIICRPICKSSCTNGFCKGPEECGCDIGYTKANDTCVPICKRGCEHGTCDAPNTCRCDSGYNLVDDDDNDILCQPICTKPCYNGTCTSPETCECLPGYRKVIYNSTDSACKPHCPSGCPLNGYCDAPDECKCNPGTRFSGKYCYEIWPVANPVCRYPCGNGSCLFRDHCLCFQGFHVNYFRRKGFDDDPVCVPICNECDGVNCVVPINSKKCATATSDDTTTTTIIPFKTKSSYQYFNVNENTTTSTTTTAATAATATTTSGTTTTATTTTATTVPYFKSSGSPERVLDNEATTNVTSGDPIAKSCIIICRPICKSSCTNGFCKGPEECGCDIGYTKANDTCVPICKRGCEHGTCDAPNTCRCDSGYNLVDDDDNDILCQPICTKPCYNGTCTSPETCECLPGYRKVIYNSTDSACKPHCPSGCPLNGYCDAPDKCKCNPGTRKSGKICYTIWPVCRYPCGNGTCLFLDHCICFPQFHVNYFRRKGFDDDPVCVPICNECDGVNCVVPINSKKCATATSDDTTTTTIIPFKTKSSYQYFNVNENTTTTTAATAATATTTSGTTTTTTATTVPYFTSSGSPERVLDNEANTNATSGYPIAKSWMQQYGTCIWIPIAVIITTGVILLLVWRRIPVTVINYFKGKSYNVQGVLLRRNVCGSFENLQFISSVSETQH